MRWMQRRPVRAVLPPSLLKSEVDRRKPLPSGFERWSAESQVIRGGVPSHFCGQCSSVRRAAQSSRRSSAVLRVQRRGAEAEQAAQAAEDAEQDMQEQVWVCARVRLNARACVCVCVCARACVRACVRASLHVFRFLYLCLCVYACVCLCQEGHARAGRSIYAPLTCCSCVLLTCTECEMQEQIGVSEDADRAADRQALER